MTKTKLAALAVFTLFITQIVLAQDIAKNYEVPMTKGPFEPTWESLSKFQCPEWFRDAKFGIWSHWSPQAVPEQGDWYAQLMYNPKNPDYNYHKEHYGPQSQFGYKDLLPLWKAENFNPEEQIKLFKRAGAKFFMALANHHDNFDCYDSKYQPWNSVNIGPKKDIVGMWRDATLKEGLRFTVSNHSARAYYWFDGVRKADTDGPYKDIPYDLSLTKADGKGKWWEGLDPVDLYCEPGTRPTERFVRQWSNRTKELITKYKPDFLYFDDRHGRFEQFGRQGMEVLAHFYNTNAANHKGKNEGIITMKSFPTGMSHPAMMDFERLIPWEISDTVFNHDTSIGDWHYKQNDKYKNVNDVLNLLVDVVSKNGTLLLCVAQRADGSLDSTQINIMKEMARWMDVSGEAVFGTRPWKKFGEGPAVWGGSESAKRGGRRDPFTSADFRFTKKGNAIYAFLMVWPTNGNITIKSFATTEGADKIKQVKMLGSKEQLKWKQNESGLEIDMPKDRPCAYIQPFKITLK